MHLPRNFAGEPVKYYNLDAVISVDYRVNSVRATQFRQWCTNVLRQFAIRGYVIHNNTLTFIMSSLISRTRTSLRVILGPVLNYYWRLFGDLKPKSLTERTDLSGQQPNGPAQMQAQP